MQFHSKFFITMLRSDINFEVNVIADSCFVEIYSVDVIEKNLVQKVKQNLFISGPVTAQLICAFVFAYACCCFSYAETHLICKI